MKSPYLLALLTLVTLLGATSEARSPIYPIHPIYPVRPIRPIRPVQPPSFIDWQDAGVVEYVGTGYRNESLNLGFQRADFVKLRVPNQCAVTIAPLRFEGEYGPVAQGSMPQAWTDGRYTYAQYRVGRYGETQIREIKMGLNSPFYYDYNHRCGVRAFVGTEITAQILPVHH